MNIFDFVPMVNAIFAWQRKRRDRGLAPGVLNRGTYT
jgi:hypothetical protein